MAEPIITVSGLRGVVGVTLTPEVALRYVAAFADSAPPGPILVARDSRPSGRMLAQVIGAGLQAVGRDTLDAGIIPTPTAGVLVRTCRAAGAVVISASHNPAEYNGLKLISAEGRNLPLGPGRKVLDAYRAACPRWVLHDKLGTTAACSDPLSAHLDLVLATVDAACIRRRAFNVLLDANHGAGGPLGRRLLESLGCRVTLLGPEPDGHFEHLPEPTAENLAGVSSAVVAAGADVGFCQDPDADRLAVIDASGRYLGEEYTLALCVAHALRQRRGPIVSNCSSSRMSEDLAHRAGVPFVRTAVGEANVVDAMLAHQALFGGEGNGGPIDLRVGPIRDSFVGMAQLLDAMAAREVSMAELAGELPRYAIVKRKLPLPPAGIAAVVDALERHFTGARIDRLDGLRLDWPDGWLLLRGSNTEPILRTMAEAQDAARAGQLSDEAAAVAASVK